MYRIILKVKGKKIPMWMSNSEYNAFKTHPRRIRKISYARKYSYKQYKRY